VFHTRKEIEKNIKNQVFFSLGEAFVQENQRISGNISRNFPFSITRAELILCGNARGTAAQHIVPDRSSILWTFVGVAGSVSSVCELHIAQ
jgi:hypothetical protein